ncbi:hypothetical protein [Ornithinimicrobium kibberense]
MSRVSRPMLSPVTSHVTPQGLCRQLSLHRSRSGPVRLHPGIGHAR